MKAINKQYCITILAIYVITVLLSLIIDVFYSTGIDLQYIWVILVYPVWGLRILNIDDFGSIILGAIYLFVLLIIIIGYFKIRFERYSIILFVFMSLTPIYFSLVCRQVRFN
jgi:hypothetical protein